MKSRTPGGYEHSMKLDRVISNSWKQGYLP